MYSNYSASNSCDCVNNTILMDVTPGIHNCIIKLPRQTFCCSAAFRFPHHLYTYTQHVFLKYYNNILFQNSICFVMQDFNHPIVIPQKNGEFHTWNFCHIKAWKSLN